MAGIAAYGGYVPRMRLQRKAIAQANAWFNPSLAAQAKGERAICNWDEDSLTMAVAAARDCLAGREDREAIGAVHLASTTLPFKDRQSATVLKTALDLRDDIETVDVTSTQRAGTSALVGAIKAVAGEGGESLVVAAEHRKARAASPQELSFGDGAAAFLLTDGDGLAKLTGHATISDDFVDHYRGANEEFDYNWEERWIRDEGYMKIVPKALDAVFGKTGAKPEDIDHFVMPSVFPQVPPGIAKRYGIKGEAIRDNLQAGLGNTGVAHPLILLAHALEEAEPGQTILVVGFGQGADALLFETTDAVKEKPAGLAISGHLARRKEETNYNKFLAFNDLVEQEHGIRSEVDKQTALTTLYRNREMLTALVGGRCTVCGTIQFPKTNVCVSPNCGEIGTQDDYPFADVPANILTWSADYLTYTIDPPAYYGMVVFKEGGRLLADFTDVDHGSIDVGSEMEMVFRVKEFDDKRGFRKYFWKAAPVYKS